jgi:hypothetical protein
MNPNSFYACLKPGFGSPAMPAVSGAPHRPSATKVKGYHNKLLQIKAKLSLKNILKNLLARALQK